MAYTTIEDVKAYMRGFDDADSSDDDLLNDLIPRVQAAIDRYCHRTFEASAHTDRYFDAIEDVGDGDWQNYGNYSTWKEAKKRRTLWLDEDLALINTITNGDGETVSSDQYITEPRNETPIHAIVLKSNSSVAWTWDETPENAIVVSGRWAYSVTAPDDIVQATIRLVAYLYKQSENYDANIDRPIVSPDGVLRLPASWPSDVLSLLTPLRRL